MAPSPEQATERRGPWPWLLLALLLLEALATAADLLLGPHGGIHPEERFNALAGALASCGQWRDLWYLQYQPFCGGCTAEALLAWPIFELLGPTVAAWKLVPAGFHLGIVALGALLARRVGGWGGAIAFALLMMGMPLLFRRLDLIGWGNHAQASLFTIASAWALTRREPVRQRLAEAGVAGLLAGLGIWFAYITIPALPALLLLCLRRGRPLRQLGVFGLGLGLGLVPLVAYHSLAEVSGGLQHVQGQGLALAPPAALASLVAGSSLITRLWGADSGLASAPTVASSYWAALWLLALAGTVLACSDAWRRRGESPSAVHAARWFGPLALAGLLLAYLLRHDLWAEAISHPQPSFYQLRYLAPVFPLLALCAVITLRVRGLRWLVMAAILAMSGLGITERVSAWRAPKLALLDRAAIDPYSVQDMTVARHGAEATIAALGEHDPGAASCHLTRLGSLGFLLGDATGTGGDPALLARSLEAFPSPVEQRVLLDGTMRGVHASPPQRARACRALGHGEPPLVEAPAGHEEAWRRAHGRWALRFCNRESTVALRRGVEPGTQAGMCEEAATIAVEVLTALEPVPSADGMLQALLRLPPACHGHPAAFEGLGWAWARRAGCSNASANHLHAIVGQGGAIAHEGAAQACRVFHGGDGWPGVEGP
jgi:hypothetical protein